MSKRKRKPPSGTNPRLDFQRAYAAEVLAAAPCAGCGGAGASHMGVWEPDPKTMREHGLDNGKRHRYVYRVCDRCLSRGMHDPAFVEAVEDRMLAEAVAKKCVKVSAS